MATLDVYNQKKEKVGEIELSDAVFNREVKTHLFWEVVRNQMANRRGGNAHTKTRSEIRGGGRKPFKQKGTGRARQGTTRAPHMVGGAVVHGPRKRDYSYTVPKKVRRQALCSAISLRAQANQLLILEDFELEAIKTKALQGVLAGLDVQNALIVELDNENLKLSCRNLASFQVMPPIGLNVYDVLRYDHLILTRKAAEAVEARLTGQSVQQESAE